MSRPTFDQDYLHSLFLEAILFATSSVVWQKPQCPKWSTRDFIFLHF